MMELPENLCHCGTAKDAASVALNLFEEAAKNNCTIWAIQIGMAMGYLGNAALEKTFADEKAGESVSKSGHKLISAIMNKALADAIDESLKEGKKDAQDNQCH